MAETVGIAFAFSYIGDAFHGSQIQPEVRTVQKDLQIAFHKAKFAGTNPSLRISSRTDAGVTARMNVAVCVIKKSIWQKMGDVRFRRSLNDHLKDVVVWAAEETSPDWNPRIASRRIYRFRLETMRQFNKPHDQDVILEVMKLFEGTHDFTGYCRPEEGRMTTRTVDYCKPWRIDGRLVGFEIGAQSFLWNQVRRMAWAMSEVALGTSSIEVIREALEMGEQPPFFGLGPSKWLTLWAIEYEDISFNDKFGKFFDGLSAPPVGINGRQFEVWQQSADHEQKQLLLNSWLPYL